MTTSQGNGYGTQSISDQSLKALSAVLCVAVCWLTLMNKLIINRFKELFLSIGKLSFTW